MPIRLDSRAPDFAAAFSRLSCNQTRSIGRRRRGRARHHRGRRCPRRPRPDRAHPEVRPRRSRPAGLKVTADEIETAYAACDRRALDALTLARDRIEAYHRRQLPHDDRFTDALGVELGSRWTAIEAVGLYVPGGTAAYPSSVLMNAVPAKVAGVPRLVMVVPAPEGKLVPLVLAAAKLAGIDEIYRVGGAQAVAALAHGTETIAPVAKIVGPGNAYVAAAKRLVFGKVGIDMIAGPSEVLILADKTGHPDWIAARSAGPGRARCQRAVDPDHRRCRPRGRRRQRPSPRSSARCRAPRSPAPPGAISAPSSWSATSTKPCRSSTPSRPSISRSRARTPSGLAGRIRNAGAIFLGAHTPEAIGDYVGGSNHVLPTARSARFSSGLGVLDFMKRTSILKCGPDQLRALGPAAIALGEAEGLDAHARSVAMRFNPR